MKKLALGLGILALSVTSFAIQISKNVDVVVDAEILPSATYEIILYDKTPGAGNAIITGDIGISHVPSNYGTRVPLNTKTIAAGLRFANGGSVVSLGPLDLVTASFSNTNVILARQGGVPTNPVDNFNSLLSVNNSGFISNNEQIITITSTPETNSSQAVAGTYSGRTALTVTINKVQF